MVIIISILSWISGFCIGVAGMALLNNYRRRKYSTDNKLVKAVSNATYEP